LDGDKLFLSMEEAVCAMEIDFCRYPPQVPLFMDLYPLILDPGIRIISSSQYNGLWIYMPGGRRIRMHKITPRKFGSLLIDTLKKRHLSASLMADICKRTFQVETRPSDEPSGANAGVWIDMDIKGFECRQCGKCCRELDYRHDVYPEDCLRWEESGRDDILDRVATISRDGQIISHAIWVNPGTRHFAEVCPWLSHAGSRKNADRWICQIHEVKPDICRQYPGTRKHALMTGCKGFDH
jgi:Fe-S-cluster containining protein